jgi:hypothetical protein
MIMFKTVVARRQRDAKTAPWPVVLKNVGFEGPPCRDEISRKIIERVPAGNKRPTIPSVCARGQLYTHRGPAMPQCGDDALAAERLA